MADTLQHGSISGSVSVRQRVSGEVVIGGKIMKELRFLPYSEFPEIGREETLYIDTDNNAMYYYDGSAYVALSGGGGGGTDNYDALSNKPSVNSVTLTGNKTSSELGLQELISDLSAIRSGATSGSTAVQPETLETALSEKQDVINDLDDIRTGAGLGETAVQPSDMESALADKQDVISDLSTIRSGASAGATAVQPSDMETALSGKQDVISDLSDIRSGASAGATAVQPSDMETALANKQDVINDLTDIRTGAASGATAVQPADMETALANKQDVISDLDTIRSGATAGNTALQPEDIDTLPTDGSSNPVSSGGTYNFVNSSIATNTAYFIGTFASVAELEAYTGTVTNNDYAFVTSTDSAGNTLYNRYKYNAATQTWSFEYAVNNTSFTTAQWAAIQSGLTASDKTKLDGIETGANKTVIDASPTSGSSNAVSSGGVHTALSGKQDTISDLSDIRSGASAGATAVQPSILSDYQTKLSGTNKLDPSFIDYDSTHAAVTDSDKTTWSGKQDAINDLSTIRSGSEAGATAVQTIQIDGTAQTKTNGVVNLPAYPTTLPASDTTSTYSSSGTAPVNGTAVNAAIGTLDVSSVGGSGKYISEISETDGKISATVETMDTTPTANSTVPVTSGGVAASQAAQDAEIAVIANAGAKNLASKNSGSGTNSTAISKTPITLPIGDYICSFSASNYSGNAAFELWDASNSQQYVKELTVAGSNSFKFTVTGDMSVAKYSLYVNNATISDFMIRPASITDATFQPYADTNPVLTQEVNWNVNTGVKNLFDINTSLPLKIYHTTYTLSDGSLTVTSNGSWGHHSVPVNLPAGNYIFTATISNFSKDSSASATSVRMRVTDTTATGGIEIASKAVTGNGAFELPFTWTGGQCYIQYYPNYTSTTTYVSSFTASNNMIRPSAITDPTYEPYSLSNPVITPAAIKSVDEGAKNLVNASNGSGVRFIDIPLALKPGDYYVLFQNLISTDTGASVCQFGAFAEDNSQASNLPQLKRGDNTGAMFSVSKQTSYVRVYASSSYAGGEGDTVTFTGCMICTAADWAVSQKYVPYCPTLYELYQMIQALQNDS